MRALATVLAFLIAVGAAPRARADEDRVAVLAAQLDAKRTEKERIAAVAALGRLGDKKALKPLVGALHDKSATVRAVAALALTKLGHRAALPALRNACNDGDELVRKRARAAVISISEANDIAIDIPSDDTESADTTETAGFGHEGHALAERPNLYVVVKSASDDSPNGTTKLDKKTKADKKAHGAIAKTTMADSFASAPAVTSTAKEAARYGLDVRNIDVSIKTLKTRVAGAYIECEAELTIAISDETGKMLSVVSGGATVQVKKASYNTAYLPELRREAIENAVKGLFDKLVDHLRTGAGA